MKLESGVQLEEVTLGKEHPQKGRTTNEDSFEMYEFRMNLTLRAFLGAGLS